jgi:hypothetical protein
MFKKATIQGLLVLALGRLVGYAVAAGKVSSLPLLSTGHSSDYGVAPGQSLFAEWHGADVGL